MLRNSSALLLAVLLAAPMSAQTSDEAQPLAKSQTLDYRLPDKLNLAWADTRARSSGPTFEAGRASESDRGPYLTLTAVQGTAGGTSYGAAAGEEEAPAGSSADDGDADEPNSASRSNP